MDGKEKCRALKQIRKQIAENNDIKYVVDECKHKGKCKGTCPKCEAEVRYLENELAKKRALGQKVAIAGVSLGIAASFSACTPSDIVNSLTYPIRDVFNIDFKEPEPEIAGDIQIDPGYIEGEVEYNPEYDLQGEPEEIYPEELSGDESEPYYDNLENDENDCVDSDSDCDTKDLIEEDAENDELYELEGGAPMDEE